MGPGAHGTLCAPSKSAVFLSSCPVEFQQSNPTGLQSQILWGLLLLLSDSQAVNPDVRLRTFTLSCCGFSFVFGYKVSFLVGSSVFFVVVVVVVCLFVSFWFVLDGCSAVSCGFGVLIRRGELMFSTLPSCWPSVQPFSRSLGQYM